MDAPRPNSETWLEGAISIEAALESESRDVQQVAVHRGKWTGAIRRVLLLAEAAKVDVERVEGKVIDEIADGRTHGGIVAKVGRRRTLSMGDLVAGQPSPFVVMLDGIEDPYNFGQAVRALYAAGVHGLVLRRRNWLSSAAVVARASAGASERIPLAIVDEPGDATAFFRERGLLIVCTDSSATKSVYETDLSRPLFLLIGGEKRGIMRSVRDDADLRLHVPYAREFGNSLGASSTASIVAFEVMRQRSDIGEQKPSHRDAHGTDV